MTKEEQLAQELRRKWEEMENTEVKIALVGQPGSGKSSLINALLGKKLFEVGVHTDTTVTAQEEKFGDLIITDLPGYGTGRFPINEWVKEFKPEEYDLYIFVFSGKLHDSDAELFKYLKQWQEERNHPFFVVRNKVDEIWDEDKTLEELQSIIRKDVKDKMADNNAKVYFTSCRKRTGLDELKDDIFASDILKVKKDKIIEAFKANTVKDLDAKKAVCLDKVDTYAYMSAANALNPIPGVDISVDIGIAFKLMDEIRQAFGLEDVEKLKKYEILAPFAKKLIDEVLKYTTKEGIILVLKKYASKIIRNKLAKYIPFAGQMVAAIAGYTMIEYLGKEYVDACYELSKLILEKVVDDNTAIKG